MSYHHHICHRHHLIIFAFYLPLDSGEKVDHCHQLMMLDKNMSFILYCKVICSEVSKCVMKGLYFYQSIQHYCYFRK